MTHDTREELKKAWIDAWEYHEDKPEHQAEWWLNHFDHQLQKARQDWLREEIVRLEEMKVAEVIYDDYPPSEAQWNSGFDYGQNKSLQTIIDRYQAELDQDKK